MAKACRLILILILAALAHAQTSPYPRAFDTITTLTDLADRAQTTLSGSLNSSATSFTVVSGSKFAANMILTIDNEQVFVTSVVSNTVNCTRGFAGTSAASHTSGTLVSDYFVAYQFKALTSSLIAIQTALGTNLANVLPVFRVSSYNFTAQAPGGSISAGSNTISMVPCPIGMNGTDTAHYVYLSAGTGTAEATLITGGTCTTGATSGTIIVTAANSHSGAWTVSSASGGISEAVQAASTAGGGVVSIPTGTIVIRAHLVLASNVHLGGQGESTILQLPNSAWPASFAGPFLCNSGNYACLITTVTGASYVEVSNLKLDMNGANNANTINGADIFLKGCLDCSVHDVVAINSHHTGGFGFSVDDSGATKNAAWDHNTIHGYGSANSGGLPTCGGGIFVQGVGGRITNNYADGLCDAAYIANAGNGIVISHNYWHQSGSAVLLGNIFSSEDSNYTVMTDNVCDGESNIGCYVIGWVAGVAGSVGGLIANNECYGGTTFACANVISDTGYTVKNVTISGNRFTRGISVGLFSGTGASGISNINITGNTINDCPGVGVFISYGANHVNIGNNTITGCLANYAIDVGTANTSDIYIHDNLLNGNAGDILDASNAATICRNHTDSSWDGQCNLINANYRTSALSNGANQNVSTVPTLPAAAVAANTVADIQFAVSGPTGAFSIGGFATPSAGRRIYVTNTTAQTMTLTHEAAGSTAANRILTPTGADVVAKVAILMYSPGQARWIVHSYQ